MSKAASELKRTEAARLARPSRLARLVQWCYSEQRWECERGRQKSSRGMTRMVQIALKISLVKPRS